MDKSFDYASPVVVMGMGRSGTSLIARILNLCGIYLGSSNHLIPAAPSNPMGHWELKDIVALNDWLLRQWGGAWDRPPNNGNDLIWDDTKKSKHFQRKSIKILSRHFGLRQYWGWKDPRTSLTFPFWKKILPKLKSIICVRHPLDVAKSLEVRNCFPLDKGLQLWLEYTRSALHYTESSERIVTHYERYFSDLEGELLRLAHFLELPAGAIPWDSVKSFVRTSLWHHRFVVNPERVRELLPYSVQKVYEDICNETKLKPFL